MLSDTKFWPQMVLLADCLCQEINANLPPVCFCGIIPGDAVIFDYCTSCGEGCGMAWVRLQAVGIMQESRIHATVTQGEIFSRCAGQLAATIEVGIARCAPMPDDDGTPPSMAAQFDAAELALADMAAMNRAIMCCDGLDQNEMLLSDWIPLGPDGGCLGGRWLVTVAETMPGG